MDDDPALIDAPETPKSLREAVAAMRVDAPAKANPKLAAFFAAANADPQLKAWWYAQQVTADRLGMSDHSWIHMRVVVNIALRLLRMLTRAGVETAVQRDYGLTAKDAEVVVAAGCLLHDTGMSVHRNDHESFSLFLAADKLPSLLADVYEEPERSIIASEALHAIIGHRKGGEPLTLEAGVVRVADALDMEHGRSRVPFEARRPNIHSLSAAAIEDVRIEPGEQRAIRIEIDMNNSAGIFQVDELLARKLRGSGLEDHIEVIARIEAEHEKRLVPIFRL